MDAFLVGTHLLFVHDPRGIGVNGLDFARGWDGGYTFWVNLRFPTNHGFRTNLYVLILHVTILNLVKRSTFVLSYYINPEVTDYYIGMLVCWFVCSFVRVRLTPQNMSRSQ